MTTVDGYTYTGWEILVFILWLVFLVGYPFVFAHDISKVLGSSRIRPGCEACLADNQRTAHLGGIFWTAVVLVALTVWVIALG